MSIVVLKRLILAGLVIALFGVGVAYSSTSFRPGFNPPLLIIVCLGFGLSCLAALLRREPFRRRLYGRLKKTGAALVVTMVTLLVLENVLAAEIMGVSTYFPREMPDTEFQLISWKTCDENGCRLNYEGITAACAAGELSGRNCVVNRQGYPDSEDFLLREDFDERYRIVTVGDSFTQGFTADIGKSWVEYLDTTIPAVEIWNFGIAGSGTDEELQSYQEFAPTFEPSLSILGFSMNDFHDNLNMYFQGLQMQDSDGNMHFPAYPKMDRWGRPIQLPQDLVLRYAAAGSTPPVNDLEARLGVTLLGTILLRVLDSYGDLFHDTSFEGQVEKTRHYLTELRDAVSALDSGFLVLLIPRLEDIGNPGQEFANAIMLMEELDIHYLNPIALLSREDYVPPPDGHWNNAGHQKIGAQLSACVKTYIDGGILGDCENVVAP